MSILSEIGAFFLGIGNDTLTFFIGAIKALAANPQVQAIATQEVANAESAAATALASGSVMTGVQKFAAAQTGVVAQLATAGLPVVMNQVNLAIEAAVANLKATPAAAPVTSAIVDPVPSIETPAIVPTPEVSAVPTPAIQ